MATLPEGLNDEDRKAWGLLLRTVAGQEAPKPDTRGLYHKFNVTRTDGSSEPGGKHENCRYFVLDLTHDKFAAAALTAYAEACAVDHPHLAADLSNIIDGLQ